MHPAATALLLEAFAQGWADPGKIGDSSARTAILRNEALESLANNLGVKPTEIEVIGEPRLGQHLAISGLLNNERKLIHSAVDRKSVFAVANSHHKSGGLVEQLPVNTSGIINYADRTPANRDIVSNQITVLALQGCNIETGIRQPLNQIINEVDPTYIALDLSASATNELPDRWDSAIFDATSWQGPAGIGLLVIRNNEMWSNPLPNLGIRRTPESFSLPLLLASAVALDAWLADQKLEIEKIIKLNRRIRDTLNKLEIGINFAGDLNDTDPKTLALVIPGCVGEDLVRQLNEMTFVLDSGSACTSDQMQPSHVLKAMNLTDEGNLRITLHHGVSEEEVNELISAITLVVQRSR